MDWSGGHEKKQAALLLAAVSVLAGSCRGMRGWKGAPDPIFRPHPGAPLTAMIAGPELTIANTTEGAVYHVVFPAEILPRIEWEPCWEPGRCDPGFMIAPGEERVYDLEGIAGGDVETLVVYRWRLVVDADGGYGQPQVEEVRAALKQTARPF